MPINEKPISPNDTAARIAQRAPLISPAADAADTTAVRMPLVDLLAGNVVQNGEIVQLLLKPSRWFIVLNSLGFMGLAVVVTLGLRIIGVRPFDTASAPIQLLI